MSIKVADHSNYKTLNFKLTWLSLKETKQIVTPHHTLFSQLNFLQTEKIAGIMIFTLL